MLLQHLFSYSLIVNKKEQKNYELSRKLIEKAGILYDKGEVDEACKLYEQAFEYFVTYGDILEYSMIKMEQGENDRALELIDGIISMEPSDFRGPYFKGVYYEYQDNDKEALTHFLKAEELLNVKEITKDYATIYFKIGRIYDDLSDKEEENKKEYLDKAKEYYLKTLEIDENYYYANLNLGSIYEKDNKLDEALRLMLKANEVEKDEKMSAYNLGVIYAKKKDYDSAVKYYLEETTKKDFYPYAYYNLGIIYKDYYKDYKKAKEYYLECLKYLKKDPSLWYNLGCIYVLLNDFTNATDCFYCAINLKKEILDYMEDDQEIKTYIINKEYFNLQNKLKCN